MLKCIFGMLEYVTLDITDKNLDVPFNPVQSTHKARYPIQKILRTNAYK